jgi:hypothetical protein
MLSRKPCHDWLDLKDSVIHGLHVSLICGGERVVDEEE